jgi:phosphoglycerate dehydrogenase-like enzyme
MNRRHFLAASTAVAGLAVSNSSQAGPNEKLKVLIPPTPPEQLADWKAVAPNVDLVECADEAKAIEQAVDAHGSYGFISRAILQAGASLRWVQQGSAGVETLMTIPELIERPVVLTNMQRVYGPEIADQAMAYLLAFTRNLGHFIRSQPDQAWGRRPAEMGFDELGGKTILIIGLGGIGSQIARRAFGFGMRVLATDPKVWERPSFVEELHRPAAFHSLLPRADVVVSAVPLTKESRKMIGAKEFAMMKPRVILINVSRGGVVDTDALIAALDRKKVAAAGLDVTDPEPLPAGHPLWSRNVIITPHTAGQSPAGMRRRDELFRENLRRFSAGESLLNVVDKSVGY